MNDLTWVDLVKGMAIIGVFFDNWHSYMDLAPTPHLHYPLANTFLAVVGPFVQVFFILSGFGSTLSYLAYRGGWSWNKWTWRRFTEIVVPYQIIVLASYVILTQNFYRESWTWNPPLWFMPVIISLYIVFPLGGIFVPIKPI